MDENAYVVVLNAPKNAGKDDAAEYMDDKFLYDGSDALFFHMMFKERLYELTAILHLVDKNELIQDATDRATKETPMDKYGGLSPRQALIHVSEDFVKPFFGKDFFGKDVLKTIEKIEENTRSHGRVSVYCFSDGGFAEEITPLLKEFGERLLIIRIHREGCDYTGDSRRYLCQEDFDYPVKFIDIYNDKTLEEFRLDVYDVVENFINNP